MALLPWLTLGVFLATNRWMGWSEAISRTHAQDVFSYTPMAAAAPGLPEHTLGSAYTERFFVHYVVGLLAHVPGVSLQLAYRIAVVAAMGGVVLVLVRALSSLGVPAVAANLTVALVVLNPYAFRGYAVVPAMLADVVFVLGLATALLGVLTRRWPTLLIGVAIAGAARQTMLVVAPVLALWVLLDRDLGSVRLRRMLAAAVVVVPAAWYIAVKVTTASFTTPFAPRIPQDTVVPLLTHPAGNASALVDHALHVAAPLALAVSAVLTLLWLRSRAGGHRPSVTFWLLLAVAAAVIAQPLLTSPYFTGFARNEPRLSALGLVPLALAVGLLLREHDLGRHPLAVGGAFLAICAASLHHNLTVVGPGTSAGFAALQVLGALALAAALIALAPPGRARLQPAP